MTNEQQTGAADSIVAATDSSDLDVADFLSSVERRADAGVEERQQQIKVLQREQRNLRAVAALTRTLTTELAVSHLGAALLTIERSKDARTYLQPNSSSPPSMARVARSPASIA